MFKVSKKKNNPRGSMSHNWASLGKRRETQKEDHLFLVITNIISGRSDSFHNCLKDNY